MDITLKRQIRRSAALLAIGLGQVAILCAQPVDAERLSRLRDTVETEVRHVEVWQRERSRGVAPVEIRVGVELEARVRRLTRAANGEQRLEAVTLADVSENGRVLVPAGAVLAGTIAPVDASSRHGGPLALAVTLHEITVGARTYAVDLRILEFVAPGIDPTSIEFVGDSVVLRADDAVTSGTRIRARVESALELTADGQ